MPYLGGYSQQGGLFGSIGKFIGKQAVGLIPGGRAAFDLFADRGRGAPTPPRIALPFGPGGFGSPSSGPAAPPQSMNAQGGPSGYRLNKTSYFLKDGTRVEAGTKWVKIRRRNPANARALRKSLSRVESFGGLVKRTRKSIRKVKSL